MNALIRQIASSKWAAAAVVLNIGLSLVLLLGFAREQTQTTAEVVQSNTSQIDAKLTNLEKLHALDLCIAYETKVAHEPWSVELVVACAKATDSDGPDNSDGGPDDKGVTVELRLPDPADLP